MFYFLCADCGGPLEYYRSDYGLCEDCEPDWDGEDDDDDYDDDDPYALFDPYWAGDVPDPFGQKVKARRRRFLKWAHVRKTPFYRRMRYTWLAGKLQLERQERLAGFAGVAGVATGDNP